MSLSYASILRDSQRARWSIDDVLTSVHDLGFEAPFLPEELVRVAPIGLTDPMAVRYANQIRAHGYLSLFGLVERFILPFVMTHAGNALHTSAEELLALMQFGEEEAKHIALFERFSDAFDVGFGTSCATAGSPVEIAGAVLAEHPLAVGLAVLHIEWMTQEHYMRSVREAGELESNFKELLRAHWVEEAQHAKLDVLLVEKMLAVSDERDRVQAVEGYVRILDSLAHLFVDQVDLDIEAFERVAGSLDGATRDRWRTIQVPAYREAFLHAGIVHRRFRGITDARFEGSGRVLDAAAARYVNSAA